MKKMRWSLTTLAVCTLLLACSSAAKAVPRTFVSGSGSDANTASNCSFTNPCRFLNTAYSVTDAGGEIIALTPAGYGGLAITTALTVQAVPGTWGFISVVPSTAGISVAAGANDRVIIRNFQFSGSPALGAGSIGISHSSGRLFIEDCTFTGLATGVSVVNSRADIVNSEIVSNTVGVSTNGTGYNPNCDPSGSNPFTAQWPGDATTQVRMERGNLSNNTTGIQMINPGSQHANCFCVPTCPFGTPTPSINPQQNLTTIFMHSTDSSSSGVTMNITGNTTFMSGTGASCTATPNLCIAPIAYSGTTNPR